MKKLLTAALALAVVTMAHAREFTALSDLEVTVSSYSAVTTNGLQTTYVITGHNYGPAPITDTWMTGGEPDPDVCEIQFSPPDGQYLVPASVSGPGSIDASWWTILWLPGEIPSGQSVQMTVTATISTTDTNLNDSIATGGYSNSDVTDTNHANNTDIISQSLVPKAAVSIFNEDESLPPARSIDDGTYWVNIVVTNEGPSISTDLTVTNILPDGCTYAVTWPEDESHYNLAGNVLTWWPGGDNPDSVWPGTTENLLIDITPTNEGNKVLTSTLYSPMDTTPGDNTATHSILITGTPVIVMVGLEGWDIVPTVNRYGTIELYLRAYNNVGENAYGVIVTNTLPSGVLFDSADLGAGTITNEGPFVIWNIGTLGPFGEATGTLYLVPLEPGTVTNHAVVTADADENQSCCPELFEATDINTGPYVCTVIPAFSTNATRSFTYLDVEIWTNDTYATGIPVVGKVYRGPGTGLGATLPTQPGSPAAAHFTLPNLGGYPGTDYISFTGVVGIIPFHAEARVDWQMMSDREYFGMGGPISNDATTLFFLDLPENMDIAEVAAGLHFDHTWPSDLEVRLTSPENSTAVLFSEVLSMEPDEMDPGMTIGSSNAFCYLVDSAVTNIAAGIPPFTGEYQTETLTLGTFTGEEAQGTWMLAFEDKNPIDYEDGYLFGWSVEITPNDGDLDNDGMDDTWETNNGLNPNDPSDAWTDLDGDGSPNRSEYRGRTNPDLAGDSLGFSWGGSLIDGDDVVIRWQSMTNQFYTITHNTNVVMIYDVIATNIPATPPTNEYRITNALYPGESFYQVFQEE